jgi:hypothetical protein
MPTRGTAGVRTRLVACAGDSPIAVPLVAPNPDQVWAQWFVLICAFLSAAFAGVSAAHDARLSSRKVIVLSTRATIRAFRFLLRVACRLIGYAIWYCLEQAGKAKHVVPRPTVEDVESDYHRVRRDNAAAFLASTRAPTFSRLDTLDAGRSDRLILVPNAATPIEDARARTRSRRSRLAASQSEFRPTQMRLSLYGESSADEHGGASA